MTHKKPSDYTFTRYLAAKKSVDDRALNEHVYQAMIEALPPSPISILEIGAGIGTMVERLHERQAFANDVIYTAIDTELNNIQEAQRAPATVDLFLSL